MDLHIASLRLAAVVSLGSALMLPNDPQFYLLAIAVVSSTTAFILQILRNSNEDRRRAADKDERLDHQAELKLEIERAAALTALNARDIKQAIQQNTDLTRVGIDAANHVQDKFDVLAKSAGVTSLDRDTNQTVHSIKDQIES